MMKEMMKKEMMEAVENYVKLNTTLESALDELKNDTMNELEDFIENLDESEIFTIVQDHLNEDIHEMDELDDVFNYMRPTEVLEELFDIDLSDDYFDADRKESFNDLLDYLGLSTRELAEKIFEGDIDVFYYYYLSEAKEIMTEYDYLYDEITKKFNYEKKLKENAEKLFKMAMEKNPEELISVLWNMNMNE